MNPLLLVGADLFFSACLTFLVFYVTWRRIQPNRPPQIKQTVKKDAAEEEILTTKGEEKAVIDEPIDESDDGDISQRVELLREMGLSVEKIAGQLKVPTGEIEMVLALSEMKKLGRGAQVKKTTRNLRKPQRPAEIKERQEYPVAVGRRPQKVWLDKQPM